MGYGQISPRKAGMFIDAMHIFLGVIIVILAIFAISDPDRYKGLFPLVFLFASMINFVTAWYEFRMFPRIRRKTVSAWIYLITGLLIFLLFVASAVSLWGK